MTGIAGMENKSGSEEAKHTKSDSDTKRRDHNAPAADDAHKTPKKRRKVNHGNCGSYSDQKLCSLKANAAFAFLQRAYIAVDP
jgi:hypothetical protein